MFRLIGSAVLAVSLLTPVGTMYAQEHHDQAQREHTWNSGENEYWHQYLKEHHKKDHDWEKASKRERSDYWKWRDQHR